MSRMVDVRERMLDWAGKRLEEEAKKSEWAIDKGGYFILMPLKLAVQISSGPVLTFTTLVGPFRGEQFDIGDEGDWEKKKRALETGFDEGFLKKLADGLKQARPIAPTYYHLLVDKL